MHFARGTFYDRTARDVDVLRWINRTEILEPSLAAWTGWLAIGLDRDWNYRNPRLLGKFSANRRIPLARKDFLAAALRENEKGIPLADTFASFTKNSH